jgi:hypothetical protein
MLADNGELEVSLSSTTTLELDTAPSADSKDGTPADVISMFQTQSIATKAVRYVSFQRAHASAVAWMTSTF